MQTITAKTLATAGLVLCSGVLASANSLVTFQVDLSTAAFDPSTQTVSVHGSFNGWGALPLTNNPAGPNPTLWSGTADIAANGTVIEYKYVIGSGTWESIPKGNNRLAALPATSGGSLVLPTAFFADVGPSISADLTFQVDMAQEINIGTFTPGTSAIYPKGTFNNWGTFDSMTNDPTILRTNQYGLVTSNVYVGTYTITATPGQTMDYKFYIDTGNRYEDLPAGSGGDPSDHNNRFLNIANTPTQVLPLVFFNNAPYAPTATNFVTFQVDMSAQVLNGSFDPAFSAVEVRGSFNGWGTPAILCTNNPTALNTNLYTAVVRVVDSVGATEQYKFWASISPNSGWETLADNRTFKLVSATSQVLPAVYFNNQSPNDLLPEDTLVTFSVNMANAVGTDGQVFNPAVFDQVFINGVPNGFRSWNIGLPPLFSTTEGSLIYTTDIVLPKGSPVVLTYKYSINGADNEAAQGSNHSRVVRRSGTYVMPPDTFGNPYSEPDFGQLAIGPVATGKVPVSWLGRPGVHLQTSADLSTGSWQDLLGTDGARWANGLASTNGFTSVTNYPTGAAKTFFRLVKP